MSKILIFIIILWSTFLFANFQQSIENSNFTMSDGNKEHFNYNRLRYKVNYKQDDFFSTFIGDVVNYWGEDYISSLSFDYLKKIHADTAFKIQTNFYEYGKGVSYGKVYRFYGGYEDEFNRVLIGLQNITMGVGRFWQPTNLFNPINIYALEPDEVFGVFALNYTIHLNDMSDLRFVVSQKEDESLKYALSYKAFLSILDLGVDVIFSEDTQMFGIELEGNLGDTGIEIRTEGIYINSEFRTQQYNDLIVQTTKDFFQGIIGADYGFQNGITVVLEGKYTSKTVIPDEISLNQNLEIISILTPSSFYLASSLSYNFNLFLGGTLLYIDSFEGSEQFISPSFTYTINDYHSLSLGGFMQESKDNRYYFKYLLSF